MGEFKPVPKPQDKPKKKKQNGYKDKDERCCYYTGEPYAERHEVYGGPNRQTSIDHGFQVDLSPELHRRFHSPETYEDVERIKYWQRYYQSLYEEKLMDTGIKSDQVRKLWMTLIGKNYLDESEVSDD